MFKFIKYTFIISICMFFVSFCVVDNVYAADHEASSDDDLMPHFELAEVIVNGKRYIAGQYMRATNNIGILGEMEQMKTPISVTTISEKAVEDFISPTDGLAGLLSLVPSVQYVGNPAVDQVTIRGFYDDGRGYTVNGIPGMTAMNRQSINYIDSVDVIEGPSTGITGTSYNAKAGGTININSKKALDDPINKVRLSWYSDNAYEEAVDLGRRFGKDNRYGVRINASNVNGDRGIDHWNLKQKDFHINLDQETDRSKTNLMLGYVDTDSQGRPIYTKLGSGVTAVPAAPKGSNNLNPEWRQDKYKQYVMTLNHEQKLADNVSAFLNAGHYKQDWYYCLENSSGTTLINNNGDYTTSFEVWPIIEKKDYVQIGLRGNFKIDSLTNNYVIGVDRQWRYSGSAGKSFGGSFTGNIYNPDSASWIKPDGQPELTAPYTAKSVMNGWSIMDTITDKDEKLSVLLGVHGHTYQNDSKINTPNRTNNGGVSNSVSPTYGINYNFNPRLSAFMSHTEQFVGGSLVSGSKYVNNGTVLDPARTKQNEIGVKFKTGDFFHKLSWFDIKQPTAVDIPAGYTNSAGVEMQYRSYDGETRHKGLEYTATGSLNDKWNLIGGFMYLDAERSKTNGGTNDGKRPNGVPEWTANLGLEYELNDNFAALVRADYIGSSMVNDEKFKVPGYFRFDLGVKYKTQIHNVPVMVRAMCYNVTDKKYWQPQGNNLYIGSPRTFTLSAEFEL
ncbi:MAG: TonB-dependent receptor [bacterium]